MNVSVSQEYEALLPKLPKEEYEALKFSIRNEGLHYPIIVNEKGTILDGHHRWRICQELQLDGKFEVKQFSTLLLEKKFVIESNLLRRQLTTFQRYEMSKPLLEIERELAKQRMLLGKEGDPTLNLEEGEAVKKVAEQAGISPALYYQAMFIDKNAPQEDLEKLRSGERAISNLYKETKRWDTIQELKEQAKTLQAPEGLFDVIVVDPPWNYGTPYDPNGRRVASPYPEMSLEELEMLKLPANDNCILWLWTTNAFLHQAFHILEAWNFEAKTILTWAKSKMGLGDWLRGQTEHCIMAIKGKPIINLTNQTTLLNGEARQHSRKPAEFYQLIDSLCFGRKLDYFSREKREGWEVYGTRELEGIY